MRTCVLCAVEGIRKKAYKGKYCEKHYEREKSEKRLTFVPLRDTWYTMVGKCSKTHWKLYQYYGARGYTVCEEWQSRDNFITWAKKQGYRFGMKLCIKDGEKEYSPDNCFLVSRKQDKNLEKSDF